jgi:hypothetical protein
MTVMNPPTIGFTRLATAGTRELTAAEAKELTMATAQKRRGTSSGKGAGPTGTEPVNSAKTKRAEKTVSSGDHSPTGERREAAALDEECIRERAYRIWIEEGQPEGRDLDHWLRARGELERKAA